MAEPSRRGSRLTIAVGTLALIAVGAVGFGLGRSSVAPAPALPATSPPRSVSPTPAPVLPAVQPPLGRAELIAAAGKAADAFAAGLPLPPAMRELAGREFDLRLPFGCPGMPQSASNPGDLMVEYEEAAEALRIRALPVSWGPEEWLPAAKDGPQAAQTADAIEGFWITRPWTSSEACPPGDTDAPVGDAAPAAAEQTLGLAQVFTSDSSRLGRRDGKAYEVVERLAVEALDTSRGLRLRLRGKLARAAGGPVLCRAPGSTRPVCLLLVTFDQIAIENPATGGTIATWDVSSQTRRSGGG